MAQEGAVGRRGRSSTLNLWPITEQSGASSLEQKTEHPYEPGSIPSNSVRKEGKKKLHQQP
jgi:hypothetical protein